MSCCNFTATFNSSNASFSASFGENVTPSGSQTFTENGTFDVTSLAEAVINVAGGGGGGMEFEVGEWTPTEDLTRGTVEFTRTHSEAPVFVVLFAPSDSMSLNSSIEEFSYFDFYKMFNGAPMVMSGTSYYSLVKWLYRSSSTNFSSNWVGIIYKSDNPSSSSKSYPRYWVTENEFHPYANSSSRYWRAGRTYKWLAIWKPSE